MLKKIKKYIATNKKMCYNEIVLNDYDRGGCDYVREYENKNGGTPT